MISEKRTFFLAFLLLGWRVSRFNCSACWRISASFVPRRDATPLFAASSCAACSPFVALNPAASYLNRLLTPDPCSSPFCDLTVKFNIRRTARASVMPRLAPVLLLLYCCNDTPHTVPLYPPRRTVRGFPVDRDTVLAHILMVPSTEKMPYIRCMRGGYYGPKPKVSCVLHAVNSGRAPVPYASPELEAKRHKPRIHLALKLSYSQFKNAKGA